MIMLGAIGLFLVFCVPCTLSAYWEHKENMKTLSKKKGGKGK